MAKELVKTKRLELVFGSLLAASVFIAGCCKPPSDRFSGCYVAPTGNLNVVLGCQW